MESPRARPGRRSRAGTLYSWWCVIYALLCLVALAIGLSYFAEPEVGPVEWTFGVLIAVPAAWCSIRAPLMRVVLRSEALVHHGLLRTRRIGRDQITEATVAETGNVTGSGAAPRLSLVGGETVDLLCLATFSESRAAAFTDRIERWRLSLPAE